jgi:hypothetical protein
VRGHRDFEAVAEDAFVNSCMNCRRSARLRRATASAGRSRVDPPRHRNSVRKRLPKVCGGIPSLPCSQLMPRWGCACRGRSNVESAVITAPPTPLHHPLKSSLAHAQPDHFAHPGQHELHKSVQPVSMFPSRLDQERPRCTFTSACIPKLGYVGYFGDGEAYFRTCSTICTTSEGSSR